MPRTPLVAGISTVRDPCSSGAGGRTARATHDRRQRREHEADHGRSSANEVRPGGSIRGRRWSLARHEA